MILKRILPVFLCAALLLCACAEEISPPLVSEPVVTDAPPVKEPYPVSFDNETFDSAPKSVASLSPALTEMLFDIGAGDAVAGVSDYCDYPSAAEDIAKIGSPANPDIGAITEIAPELLLIQSPISETDLITLRRAGIRVLRFETPKSFAMLCEHYIKLTMVFRGAADFQDAAAETLLRIDSQMTEANDLGIFRTFVVVEGEADDGLLLSPRDTICSDMLSVFGQNVWTGGQSYTASEKETDGLLPDIVFYSDDLDEDDIEKYFPISKLIPIDFERFERPTVRLADEIAKCAAELMS